MITTAQYEKAITRLMELNNLYTVPGDKEDIEKEYLMELISEYETSHDAEALAEHEAMVDFEDRFLASMER